MEVNNILQMASYVCVCVGVVTAIIQTLSIKKSYNADHERRKKQATIEFCHKVEKDFSETLEKIDERFPNGQVINVHDIEKDKDLIILIEKYLFSMGNIAVGIQAGVYDIAVFDKMSGVYATKYFERFREVISYIRKNDNYPIAYKPFEDLIYELRDFRKKRFPVQENDFAKMKYDLN